ncbi:hypothetical protein M758_1G123400 [Ceratodon purpureus]|nr:hypothetical protein M758_1G123400 [Ceratodon purpureus]
MHWLHSWSIIPQIVWAPPVAAFLTEINWKNLHHSNARITSRTSADHTEQFTFNRLLCMHNSASTKN